MMSSAVSRAVTVAEEGKVIDIIKPRKNLTSFLAGRKKAYLESA
jgi:hypothetical protein